MVLIIAGAVFVYNKTKPPASPSPSSASTPSPTDTGNGPAKADLIRLETPQPNEIIKSPLTVKGQARGFWFFEASFPVKILDADGNQLAIVPAQAQGDWMTEDFVPFLASLEFDRPAAQTGFLVLEKDNPSGLPQNADELKIPIKFY